MILFGGKRGGERRGAQRRGPEAGRIKSMAKEYGAVRGNVKDIDG